MTSKEYKNNKEKLTVEDKKGYKYQINYNNFMCMKKKSLTKFHYSNIYTPTNIQLYFDENNINLKILDITPRNIKVKTDKIKFICECGKIFESNFQNIYYNKTKRCKNCSLRKSELEWKISDYLDKKKVKYIEQYSFDDCKIKRICKFDFYLPDYNLIIEVNGEQHYYENSNFRLSLYEQQIRDDYKKKYCIKNNIKYLEIPFWDIRNNNNYKIKIDKILS